MFQNKKKKKTNLMLKNINSVILRIQMYDKLIILTDTVKYAEKYSTMIYYGIWVKILQDLETISITFMGRVRSIDD